MSGVAEKSIADVLRKLAERANTVAASLAAFDVPRADIEGASDVRSRQLALIEVAVHASNVLTIAEDLAALSELASEDEPTCTCPPGGPGGAIDALANAFAQVCHRQLASNFDAANAAAFIVALACARGRFTMDQAIDMASNALRELWPLAVREADTLAAAVSKRGQEAKL